MGYTIKFVSILIILNFAYMLSGVQKGYRILGENKYGTRRIEK